MGGVLLRPFFDFNDAKAGQISLSETSDIFLKLIFEDISVVSDCPASKE